MRPVAIAALVSLACWIARRIRIENRARDRELYRRAAEARASDRCERFRIN